MHPKVERFLREARNKELQEREKILIELGLYEEKKVDKEEGYDAYSWDKEQNKLIHIQKMAIKVSDEEYSEIIKHYKSPIESSDISTDNNNHMTSIDNNAEHFLGVINKIGLYIVIFVSVFVASIFLFTGEFVLILPIIVIVFLETIMWAINKVVLNISNNLHQINAKLK